MPKTVKEVLQEKETAEVLTSGGSMRPLLKQHRDIAVIARIKSPLKKGDVILYEALDDKPLVLHRIVKVLDNGFVTRGDNCFYTETVSKENVVGILSHIYRNGRYINCEKNIGYKIYVFINRISYPIRLLIRKTAVFLVKLKHRKIS
jgi:signal peptidase I